MGKGGSRREGDVELDNFGARDATGVGNFDRGR